MADTNIQQILQALAASQSASGTPIPGQQPPPNAIQQPPPGMASFVPAYATPQPPSSGGFALPQPKSSGAVDLSSIRPSNSGSVSLGSVSIQDAINKIRGTPGMRGNGLDSGRDSRGRGDSYRRSRSRSRSPGRFRDVYGSAGNDRKDDRRYARDRSRSPRRDSYSGDGSAGDPGHEVLAIESNLVGLIIGQQGKNLRRVEQETNARVQFLTGPESSGPTRQCKISGTFQARESAKAQIRRIISENGNPIRGNLAADNRERARPQSQQKSQQQVVQVQGQGQGQGQGRQEDALQIMVPNRTVGLIIGRGGETIKDLQERSGCHVNILGEEHSVNGLRPVNLIGPESSQQIAKNIIMEVVESDNKNMASGVNAGRVGGDRAPSGQNLDASKIEDTIYVPSEAVGMIIGKGGETIKEMQNISGCKINVSQGSGRDVQREIGLVGSRGAIELAKNLIMEKVRAVEDKNRGGRREQGSHDAYSQQPLQSYQQTQQHQHQQQQQPSYAAYAQPTQGYQQQQQPQQQQQQQQPSGQTQASGEDPYAAYGGYANYLQMWYAAAAAQQQQQPTPGQGGPKPPG